MKKLLVLLVVVLLISGCISKSETPAVQPVNGLNGVIAAPASISAATSTPEIGQFSLESLIDRTYGNGIFTVDRLWYSYDRFKRYYIIYDSDGLSIHGYVNVPNGEGPFPVIMMLHGYIQPEKYTTLDYTLRYADDLAQHGYIVLHPNMRNFPPSDSAENRHDNNTGYTIDVLNLLAYFREMAGKEGIFKSADLNRIGIWGHSIGGNIAMRTMSVEPDAFKAAILYGAVSQRNGNILDSANIYDFSDVETQISIHHGMNDDEIPVEQSQELCRQLKQLGKDPECFYYEGQPHTFYRDQWADPLFMERTLGFFDLYVKNIVEE
jgi:dipeptidyl aminopeptidase/acylaminoacyl peptidase